MCGTVVSHGHVLRMAIVWMREQRDENISTRSCGIYTFHFAAWIVKCADHEVWIWNDSLGRAGEPRILRSEAKRFNF